MCLYFYDPASSSPVTILFANEGIVYSSSTRVETVVDILIENTTEKSLDKVLIIYPYPFCKFRRLFTLSRKKTDWKIVLDEDSFTVENDSLGNIDDTSNFQYKSAGGYKEFEQALRERAGRNEEGADKSFESDFDPRRYLVGIRNFTHYDFRDTGRGQEDIEKYRVLIQRPGVWQRPGFSILEVDFAKPVAVNDRAFFRLLFKSHFFAKFDNPSKFFWWDYIRNTALRRESRFNFSIHCPENLREEFLNYLRIQADQESKLKVAYQELYKLFDSQHGLGNPEQKLRVKKYRLTIFPTRHLSFQDLTRFFQKQRSPVPPTTAARSRIWAKNFFGRPGHSFTTVVGEDADEKKRLTAEFCGIHTSFTFKLATATVILTSLFLGIFASFFK